MSWKPEDFEDWPAALVPSYGPYRARIKKIVDGDTYDAFVDLGGRSYQPWRVRLLAGPPVRGVDTPETNRGSTRAAGFAAKHFVADVMPIGTHVLLADTAPDPDEFGRWLARVVLPGGWDLGTLLLSHGHAVLWEG